MDINFTNALWERQEEYMEERGNYIGRFNAFEDIFNYFQTGQTVAQIACGGVVDDLFLTMEQVGKEGRVILIDEDPAFVYNRVSKILGEENLSREKEFYTQTDQGKQLLKELFSQANVEAYVQHLPPYPEGIENGSIDHVMAIDAAFELMAAHAGEEPDVEGLITETYQKLKHGGNFFVQGRMGEDIDLFRTYVWKTIEKKELDFEEDPELLESLHSPFSAFSPGMVGYWGRWVKG